MSQWLEELIDRSIAERLCTSPYCTTCGAFKFRKRVFLRAMTEGGIDTAEFSRSSLKELTGLLSAEQRETVFYQITRELREVRRSSERSDAIKVVLVDLDPPLMKWGVGTTLDRELDGTTVGDLYVVEPTWTMDGFF